MGNPQTPAQTQAGPPIDKAEAHRVEMDRIKGLTAEAIYEQGRKSGMDEGVTLGTERTTAHLKAVMAACPGDERMAVNAFLTGQSAEAVKMVFEATNRVKEEAAQREQEQALKIARLEQLAACGGHAGVNMGFTVAADLPDGPTTAAQAKAIAEQEWDSNPAVRRTAKTKEIYVLARTAELDGSHRTLNA